MTVTIVRGVTAVSGGSSSGGSVSVSPTSLFGNVTGATSSGQSITLGNGLSFSGTTLVASAAGGFSRVIQTITSAASAASATATDYVYFVTGTTTITMPTAVSNTGLYTIKRIGNNTVTISFTGGQTADGSASLAINVQNVSLNLVSDNSNWNIV